MKNKIHHIMLNVKNSNIQFKTNCFYKGRYETSTKIKIHIVNCNEIIGSFKIYSCQYTSVIKYINNIYFILYNNSL